MSDLNYRTLELRPDHYDEKENRLMLAFVSEEPVRRDFGYEVIAQDRMDLSFMESGRAPLLWMHDAEQVLGVVERVEVNKADRKSRAAVRLGKSTDLQRQTAEQISDGILSNVSVGYSISEMEETEERIDGVPVFRVSAFPQEISLVSIPADKSVGIGRDLQKPIIQEVPMEDTKVKVDEMIVDEKDETVDVNALRRVHDQALAERAKANQEIISLAVRHNKRQLADDAIGRNMSLEEFRGHLLNAIDTKPLDAGAEPVEKPKNEKRTYSFLRALNAASRGDWSGAGFEAEMSAEVAHRRGRQPEGFYVPDFAWGTRELTVGTNASGGFFAPSVQLSSEWINALRAKMVLPGLGMRIMSGLQTKIQIPKITAGASAGFVAESGAVSDQTQTTGQITMQARTLGARTDVSRLLLLESDPSIEQIVRDDLVAAVADKIEDVAIEGGGSNEPTGITQTSGIGSVAIGTNGGAPTWASVVQLVKEVEIDNAAINGNTLGYLTNPKVKSKLASTPKVASTDSVMIMNEPYTSLYGYPIAFTTNVPSDLTKGSTSGSCSAMLHGDFSQALLGVFNTPQILVDPYTNSTSGTVRIVVMNEVDFAVRHAQSFAAVLDYTTT